MLVLRDGIFVNRRHFRELLQKLGGGVASNIGSNRPKRRVAADLLSREGATHGQGAGYSLTEAGIETLPLVVARGNWASPTRAAPRAAGAGCSATAVRARWAGQLLWLAVPPGSSFATHPAVEIDLQPDRICAAQPWGPAALEAAFGPPPFGTNLLPHRRILEQR